MAFRTDQVRYVPTWGIDALVERELPPVTHPVLPQRSPMRGVETSAEVDVHLRGIEGCQVASWTPAARYAAGGKPVRHGDKDFR